MQYLAAGIVCFLGTAVLHAVLLRLWPALGLLITSLACNLAVIAAALLLAWWGLSPLSVEATLHGAATAFFAYQLFFFLGPATADRSMTAHLLLYLKCRGAGGASAAQLLADYAPEEFLHKRLQECRDASLTCADGDPVRLAWRGRLMSRIYAALLSMYGLQARPQWRDSFRRGPP